MALTGLLKWGGIIPRIYDPRLIPEGKGQRAINCRFDHGGVRPLGTDTFVATPTVTGTLKSIYLYYNGTSYYWLAWTGDVYATLTPIANDSFHRLYYTEGGVLKVTSTSMAGWVADPLPWMNPSPPAPTAVPQALLVTTSEDAIPITVISWSGINAGQAILTIPGGPALAVGTSLTVVGTGYAVLDNKIFTVAAANTDNYALVESVQPLYVGAVTSFTIYTAHPLYTQITTTLPHGLIVGDAVFVADETNACAVAYVIDANNFAIKYDFMAELVAFTLASKQMTFSAQVPTAISKANPANVTLAAHGLTTGMRVHFAVSAGMVELNGWEGSVTVIDSSHFTLNGLDSTSYTTYTSGSFIRISGYINSAIGTVNSETRFYVQTFVNSFGDEGPPGPVSNQVVWNPGDTVIVSSSLTLPDAGFDVVTVNTYRTNQEASNLAQFQFVSANSIATAMVVYDTLPDAALGEVLASAEWDAAPSGITGLIRLWGGVLAGYVGNTLCLSVPYFPHAWPVAWRQNTEHPIRGLVAFGNTVVCLTTGSPEAFTFNDPSTISPETTGTTESCVSARSVVDMGGYGIYASPEGLVAIGPGMDKLITTVLFAREDWQTYNPSTIYGYLWEGMYVGFYTLSGGSTGGFLFDPRNGDFINLNFYSTPGYYDRASGLLYIVIGANIVSFATNESSPRSMDSLSRREVFKPTMPTAIKVLANAYPVSVDIIYPLLVNGSGAAAPQTITVSVTSKNPQRLPMANAMPDAVDIRVYGTKGATAVYMAGSIEDLPQ